MTWTPNDLPDLTGTTAVVTGANSGIGFETARALAARGASVTLACRNVAKGEHAAELIRNGRRGVDGHSGGVTGVDVRVAELDLSSLASVRRFAEAWQGPLNLLVNNAGVMAPRKWVATTDGRMSRVPWNFGGGPMIIRLRSRSHHDGRHRQSARRHGVRVRLVALAGAGGR